MSRLDCVNETLRLALLELEPALSAQARPAFWLPLWERYVETQVDYRASSETLARKLVEAGTDAWKLLEWLCSPTHGELNSKPQVLLLKRVFQEQFEIVPERIMVPRQESGAADSTESAAASDPNAASTLVVAPPSEPSSSASIEIRPKSKDQVETTCVRNPHDPEATYSVKGQGQQKREHVGYKVQVAETVCEATLAAEEPTRNFIVGIVTHLAYEHDEIGAIKMELEQAHMGFDKPSVLYVDASYVSAQKLARAQAEGREIIGPALPGPQKDGRFTASQFRVNVEQRQAVCPAGNLNTQCSRLIEASTGNVNYRFEFSTQCQGCGLRDRCLGQGQRHRTLLVGEYYTSLQTRRQEQQTAAFKQRMKHRNGIEGTQSELVRAHGLRRARYRGLARARLQSYFAAAACNAKRWVRREAWQLRQASSALARD
jgi:hypothetical protein